MKDHNFFREIWRFKIKIYGDKKLLIKLKAKRNINNINNKYIVVLAVKDHLFSLKIIALNIMLDVWCAC
jgi:hypothetical protein